MTRITTLLSTAALVALALAACGDDTEDASGPVPVPANAAAALTTYAQIVHASYLDSHAAALELQTAVDAFVADPDEDKLTAAKDAWKASRVPYLLTEVYRFYDGPIDDADGPEGLLNAWPLDENHIDYVDGEPNAGIVNDTSIAITPESLEAQNENGGEANVATGYHAVEFLLWGQDTSADSAGTRPATDFVDGGTAANQDRRRDYLSVVTGMIPTHLELMVNAWADGGNNYRAEFVALDPAEGLRRILTGMIVLSGFETGGERLQPALDSGSQEDEHSCFSDNTHVDMIQDAQGVQNVYLGTYGNISGTSVYDVVAAADQALADQLRDEIAASVTAATSMQRPFDQAIALGNTEGRAGVQALITALRQQERTMEAVFTMFGLTIPQPE